MTQPSASPISPVTTSSQNNHTTRQSVWSIMFGLKGKLILPYLLLTVVLAVVGTYIITRLVAASFTERLLNQLYEASRVAAESIVRRERTHLEQLRPITFTEGVPEAFADRDKAALGDFFLAMALNNNIEIITAVDLEGQEILTLGLDRVLQKYIETSGTDFSSFEPVRKILTGEVDARGDKFTDLTDTKQGKAFLTCAGVRSITGELTGVLMMGTYLETLLNDAKNQALADIVLLDNNLDLLGTTLASPADVLPGLQEKAKLINPVDPTIPQPIELYQRSFEISYSPFIVREQSFGWMGVLLTRDYVVSAEATNRNIFSLVFTLGAAAIIGIGYLLAQSIAQPLLKLRTMSQEVASGNLGQTSDLERNDEIGELANAFDQMTLQLRERTEEAARLYAETVQRNKELATINTQLQQMQNQLVQAEKLSAVGQLTAGIVHDVKNPLSVIKGLSEMMLGDNFDSETQQSLKMIFESAEKANNIVTDLLKFARQSATEANYLDMRDSVEAVLRLTAFIARKANVVVIKDLPDEPVMLWYDAQQIEQVFFNMINNGIQAMPESGTLRVSLAKVKETVAIAFQDTGVGIPPENLRRIFDPFFTTKPPGQGTGLGLSVGYGVVSSHNGQIQVESTIGKGTTFTILLPVDQELQKQEG